MVCAVILPKLIKRFSYTFAALKKDPTTPIYGQDTKTLPYRKTFNRVARVVRNTIILREAIRTLSRF